MSGCTLQSVVVVGAGTMGNGIAQTFAASGASVKLVDSAQPALERGMAHNRNTKIIWGHSGDIQPSALAGVLTRNDNAYIDLSGPPVVWWH